MGTQGVLFDPRFLDLFAGPKLLGDPRSALVELVANAWDAGATRVEISWPTDADEPIVVRDNGHGMTEKEFVRRWRTLAYDRLKEQGPYAQFPSTAELPPRPVFGRNGVGRFAAFCFGQSYEVRTFRDGACVHYTVTRGEEHPLVIALRERSDISGHGTEITIPKPSQPILSAGTVRTTLGSRFLADPNFEVVVAGERVAFTDLPAEIAHTYQVEVVNAGEVFITVIRSPETDRTTRQHGIAWHVNGRLVGECSWRGFTDQAFIDGRRAAAKQYTFIVRADFLAPAVLKDWSGFDQSSDLFSRTNDAVSSQVRLHLIRATSEKRKEAVVTARATHRVLIEKMTPLSRQRWSKFLTEVQDSCLSITDDDIVRLAGVLAKLEIADSKYGLLGQLDRLASPQLDDLNTILDDWTLEMAKLVLDELKARLTLLDELQQKVLDQQTRELQDLQPIFERGLWIFGPEYETIEFTSNQTMTTVIRDLFGERDGVASRNRPDFAILPDATVGLYSYPDYDPDGGETGVARLTIVELKRPGIAISTDQKDQCWKYVKELYSRGHLTASTRVSCFVLGSLVDPVELQDRTERDGRVVIKPLTYATVVDRAKSRVLKLYDRVRSAPFLDRDEVERFLAPDPLDAQVVLPLS